MIKLKATKRWFRQAAKDEVGLEMTAGIQSVKPDRKQEEAAVFVGVTAVFLAIIFIVGVVQLFRFVAMHCKSSLC